MPRPLPGFDSMPVLVGFVVVVVAVGRIFLLVFRFSPVAIIPPVLRTHSFIHQPPTLYDLRNWRRGYVDRFNGVTEYVAI